MNLKKNVNLINLSKINKQRIIKGNKFEIKERDREREILFEI